jgi:hypothetical protein
MTSTDDVMVVATVRHLMQSGHLKWRRRAGLDICDALPAA